MLRKVKIYFGNAAKFDSKNLYELDDYFVNENGEIFNQNNEKLKEKTKYGYKYVQLIINGSNRNCKVHRIVACTFTDICGEFNEVVNHLDENKSNNKAGNLRWVTSKENLEWGTINERRQKTIEETSKIKSFVKKIYKKYDLKYTSCVKLKRFKKTYKIIDEFNDLSLYFSLKDIEKILNNDTDELSKGTFIKLKGNSIPVGTNLKTEFIMGEKEKAEFVSGKFLTCITNFGKFKKGERYWLEYIGKDTYIGRSDNILDEQFHISELELRYFDTEELTELDKFLYEWFYGMRHWGLLGDETNEQFCDRHAHEAKKELINLINNYK